MKKEEEKTITLEEKKEELKNNYKIILELEKEKVKNGLEEKNILVKNNSFTLNEEEKKIIEEKLNYNFSKKYFSIKNAFLYNAIKSILEFKVFTFYSEEELNTKAKEELEELEEELKTKLEEELKGLEKKS